MKFPADISKPAEVSLTSDASNRDAVRLVLVVAQFGLDLEGHPRYGRRDITGDDKDETFCNIFLRDYCAAMGTPVEGLLANNQIDWLGSPAAKTRGWAEVSQHAAQGCADEGFPVVVGWHSGGSGPGHVAVMMPSLGERLPHIAQAGRTCFSWRPLTAGFGARPVRYFAHP